MRAILLCPYCQEKAEHVVENDGDDRLAWCQNCFHVWREGAVASECRTRLEQGESRRNHPQP